MENIADNITDEYPAKLFEHYQIIVDPGQSACRIDKFLMDRLPDTSRTKIQLAIDNQFILINGAPTRASYKVRPGDNIQVVLPTPPRTNEILPEDITLSIIYEDEELLIVNKPPNMVVHPGHNNWTGTLLNALLHHFNQLPTGTHGMNRPGLVHRIDKDTSGLLVIAKTEQSLMILAKQFYDHSIERSYYALVWGEPTADKDTIDINLGRSLNDRRVITTYQDANKGKRAITHYEVLERLQYVSLIKCTLETGRTHQIRAHMRYIGHPIFGDVSYGGQQIVKGDPFSKYKAFVENCFQIMPRQALHAYSLGFMHPKCQEKMYFEVPFPIDFQTVLERWKKYAHYH